MKTTKPESKSHQRLRSRIQYLLTHLEIMDASIRVTIQNLKVGGDNGVLISKTIGVDCSRYKELDHPLTEVDRITNHSRSKNSESAIISAYTHFAEYLQGILTEMYEYNPLLVVGKAVGNHTLTFPEIVKLGDFAQLSSYMVSQVFRSLENERSTRRLLDRILANTGAKVAEKLVEDALSYLEMRHIFIHGAGIADELFVHQFGAKFSLNVGDKLPSDFVTSKATIEAVSKLCQAVDSELLKAGVLKPWAQ